MRFKPYTVSIALAEDGTLTVTKIDAHGKLEALTGLSSADVLATPSGFKLGVTESPAAREAVENMMEALTGMGRPMTVPAGDDGRGQYL